MNILVCICKSLARVTMMDQGRRTKIEAERITTKLELEDLIMPINKE